ncbi:MAG: Hpt domain-containing protein, partial [Gemmataceae bacterium]
PIIALTANAMKSDMDACRKAGMDDFLSKPIERESLIHVLTRWIPADTMAPVISAYRTETPHPEKPASTSSSDQKAFEGLDIPGTVRRLGLPFDRLLPMFLRFAEGLPKMVSDIQTAVASGEPSPVARTAHALAGAAGNLGADRLRAACKALELAAKEKSATWGALLTSVESEAKIVLESLEKIAPKTPAPTRAETPSATETTMDIPAIRALLLGLRDRISESDLSGASEKAASLATSPAPEAIARAIADIASLVDGYEFDAALERLEQLLDNPLLRQSP